MQQNVRREVKLVEARPLGPRRAEERRLRIRGMQAPVCVRGWAKAAHDDGASWGEAAQMSGSGVQSRI